MSAIAGIWYTDGRCAAHSSMRMMLDALEMYGSDRRAQVHSGPVALGKCMLRVVPEDAYDSQPSALDPQPTWMVADARIDNREELADQLELDLATRARTSDAELLLRAWQRWNQGCLNRVVGAFAFAVWDALRQQLFLARDHVGYRPLFFHRSSDTFAFASMPKGLFALPFIVAELDEEQLALHLALVREMRHQTLFCGIERLLPGQCAVVTAKGLRRIQYWQPDDAADIRFGSDDEYVEAFRERFDRAVRAQLRTSGLVASHLSGGLDSSSVTATAARLLNECGRPILAMTAVPRSGFAQGERPGWFGDEGPAAAMVAQMYPSLEHVRIDTEGRSMLTSLHMHGRLDDRPVFNPTNALWLDAIRDLARQRGARVLLTGQFGNASISDTGTRAFSEWFRTGRWRMITQCGRALVRNGYMSARTVLGQAIRPSLPAWLQMLLGWHRESLAFSLVHPALARSLQLELRANASFMVSGRGSRALSRSLFDRIDLSQLSLGTRAGWSIDERDPTRDRRILEFCFGIPPEQFLAGGQTRSLVRRGMHGRLPQATLMRRKSGQQSADWFLAVAAERPAISAEISRLEHSAVARRCIDLPRMRYLLDHWPDSGFGRHEVIVRWHHALTRGLSVGCFISQFEGTTYVSKPCAKQHEHR